MILKHKQIDMKHIEKEIRTTKSPFLVILIRTFYFN